MKYPLLVTGTFLFLYFHSDLMLGQVLKSDVGTTTESPVAKPDVMPEYIGGESKLFEFISSNIMYPEGAMEKGITGKVFVNFIVDKTGKVRHAKILRGIGAGCDEEVLRVISIMPDWIPGKKDGKPVSVSYNLPVNFRLNNPPAEKGK